MNLQLSMITHHNRALVSFSLWLCLPSEIFFCRFIVDSMRPFTFFGETYIHEWKPSFSWRFVFIFGLFYRKPSGIKSLSTSLADNLYFPYIHVKPTYQNFWFPCCCHSLCLVIWVHKKQLELFFKRFSLVSIYATCRCMKNRCFSYSLFPSP